MSESPKPADALRTLPERAFRARARLVAGIFCLVCCGLAVRLLFLQVLGGGWYTDRALGQQLRDTVVPADRGRIYSADGVLLAANSSCWTLRASPREMPEDKLALAAKGLAEILELDEGEASREIQRPSLQRLPPALPGRPGHGRRRAGLLRGKRHHRHPHQSGLEALVPAGGFWPRCWGSPMWTTRASRASN